MLTPAYQPVSNSIGGSVHGPAVKLSGQHAQGFVNQLASGQLRRAMPQDHDALDKLMQFDGRHVLGFHWTKAQRFNRVPKRELRANLHTRMMWRTAYLSSEICDLPQNNLL